MRRLATSIALAFACGLTAAAGVSATSAWDTLPYYDKANGVLRYATEGSWSGADAVKVGRYEWDKYTEPFAKVGRRYIWGPTCGRGRERRTFTKTIMVPGRPMQGSFLFSYAVSTLLDRPWEGASFRVNGVEIARLPRTAGVPVSKAGASWRTGSLSARARQAFRFGPNTLSITATKAPLKRGQRCNDPRVPRYIAVFGELYLEFGTDLKVAPPQIPFEVIRNVTNGQAVGLNGTLQLTNAGPSAAIDGTLTVDASGPGQSTVALTSGNSVGPFKDCTSGLNAPLVCTISEFRAGTTAQVPFIAALRVDTAQFRNGAGRLNVQVVLSGKGLRSVGLGDEVQTKVIVLCAAGATDPACA